MHQYQGVNISRNFFGILLLHHIDTRKMTNSLVFASNQVERFLSQDNVVINAENREEKTSHTNI